MQEALNMFKKESRHTKILHTIAILFALLALLNAALRFIDYDEFEHIHSAWYITQGYQPYFDFLQVHRPLFRYRLKKNANFDTYSKIAGNRLGDTSITDLTPIKKPKFISDIKLQLNTYNLNRINRKTEFRGLYERSELE
jgi:hypothetical protein